MKLIGILLSTHAEETYNLKQVKLLYLKDQGDFERLLLKEKSLFCLLTNWKYKFELLAEQI